MSYRFEKAEPISDGIQRMALEQIDDAWSELTLPSEGPDEAIHEARKCLKKVRALLRLVRDTVGSDVFKSENGWYRDAGRRLSRVRDSAVRVETLDALAAHFDDQLSSDAWTAERRRHVRRKLVDAHDAVREHVLQKEHAMDQVAALLKCGRARVEDWPIEGEGFAVLRDGLKRVYKRGYKALGNVRAEPITENLHELRKRAKYLWYHARILGPSWSDVLGAFADEIHTLSDHLGDDHDLALLGRFLEGDSGETFDDPAEVAALLDLIDKRREELQAASWPFAERIYVEKPKRFVRRIAGYWRVWRA